jgi:hypothetical protein
VRCIRSSKTGEVRAGNRNQTCRYIHVVNGAIEERQGGHGYFIALVISCINCRRRLRTLIVRHLVPCFVDPREGEVTILSHLSVFDSIYDKRFIASGVELSLMGVVDVLGNSSDRQSAPKLSNSVYFTYSPPYQLQI